MYPICLEISDKLCIIAGGGSVAERKVFSLLTARAKVRVISPALTNPLRQLADEGRIEWQQRGYQSGDLTGALLVFAATDNSRVQKEIIQEARQANQLINVIDSPEECGFQVPAVVRQGDLTLAVSTNGKSPAMAAMVRQQLEESFGAEYGLLLEIMSRLRKEILAGDRVEEERKKLFQKILHDDILSWLKNDQQERVYDHLSSLLGEEIATRVCQ